MTHLTDERLTDLAFESIEPTPAEAAHLDECPVCAQAYADLTMLASELQVAARSHPSSDAVQRYYGLFDQVEQQPQGLKALWRDLVAALVWDSRQQAALQGVRSVVAAEYRLLYSAGSMELELMVETDGRRRHVEGDLIAASGEAVAPALVTLERLSGESAPVPEILETEILETETADGRFRLQDVVPGRYRMTVATLTDETIVVDSLDIT
jgi:hypothetical protein